MKLRAVLLLVLHAILGFEFVLGESGDIASKDDKQCIQNEDGSENAACHPKPSPIKIYKIRRLWPFDCSVLCITGNGITSYDCSLVVFKCCSKCQNNFYVCMLSEDPYWACYHQATQCMCNCMDIKKKVVIQGKENDEMPVGDFLDDLPAASKNDSENNDAKSKEDKVEGVLVATTAHQNPNTIFVNNTNSPVMILADFGDKKSVLAKDQSHFNIRKQNIPDKDDKAGSIDQKEYSSGSGDTEKYLDSQTDNLKKIEHAKDGISGVAVGQKASTSETKAPLNKSLRFDVTQSPKESNTSLNSLPVNATLTKSSSQNRTEVQNDATVQETSYSSFHSENQVDSNGKGITDTKDITVPENKSDKLIQNVQSNSDNNKHDFQKTTNQTDESKRNEKNLEPVVSNSSSSNPRATKIDKEVQGGEDNELEKIHQEEHSGQHDDDISTVLHKQGDKITLPTVQHLKQGLKNVTNKISDVLSSINGAVTNVLENLMENEDKNKSQSTKVHSRNETAVNVTKTGKNGSEGNDNATQNVHDKTVEKLDFGSADGSASVTGNINTKEGSGLLTKPISISDNKESSGSGFSSSTMSFDEEMVDKNIQAKIHSDNQSLKLLHNFMSPTSADKIDAGSGVHSSASSSGEEIHQHFQQMSKPLKVVHSFGSVEHSGEDQSGYGTGSTIVGEGNIQTSSGLDKKLVESSGHSENEKIVEKSITEGSVMSDSLPKDNVKKIAVIKQEKTYFSGTSSGSEDEMAFGSGKETSTGNKPSTENKPSVHESVKMTTESKLGREDFSGDSSGTEDEMAFGSGKETSTGNKPSTENKPSVHESVKMTTESKLGREDFSGASSGSEDEVAFDSGKESSTGSGSSHGIKHGRDAAIDGFNDKKLPKNTTATNHPETSKAKQVTTLLETKKLPTTKVVKDNDKILDIISHDHGAVNRKSTERKQSNINKTTSDSKQLLKMKNYKRVDLKSSESLSKNHTEINQSMVHGSKVGDVKHEEKQEKPKILDRKLKIKSKSGLSTTASISTQQKPRLKAKSSSKLHQDAKPKAIIHPIAKALRKLDTKFKTKKVHKTTTKDQKVHIKATREKNVIKSIQQKDKKISEKMKKDTKKKKMASLKTISKLRKGESEGKTLKVKHLPAKQNLKEKTSLHAKMSKHRKHHSKKTKHSHLKKHSDEKRRIIEVIM